MTNWAKGMVSVAKAKARSWCCGGELCALGLGSHGGCRFKAHPARAYMPDVCSVTSGSEQLFQVSSSSLIGAMDNYSLHDSNVKRLL